MFRTTLALFVLAAAPAFAVECHPQLASSTVTFSGLLAGQDCTRVESGRLEAADVPWTVQTTTGLPVSAAALDAVITGLLKADIATRELGIAPIKSGRIVTVTLADEPDPDGSDRPEGEADFINQRCYITILPDGYRGDLTRLAKTTAHEYFHCVLAGNFGNGWGNYLATPGIRPHDWFNEGAPEWFGHFAVSGDDSSFETDRFELRADHWTMDLMGYAGFVFFTWYAESYGAERVMPFLRRLGAEHGEVGPIMELLEAEEWLDFAKRYAAYQIRYRDRSRVVPEVRQPRFAVEIDDDGAETFSNPYGRFRRNELVFGPGEWELTPGEGGPFFLSRILSNGDPDGSWEEIAEGLTVKSGCGREERRVMLGFGLDPAETRFELKVTRIGDPCDAPCAQVPVARDQCLIGRWEDTTFTPPVTAAMPGTEIRAMEHPAPVYTFFDGGNYRNDTPFFSDVITRVGANWMINQISYDVNAALGFWGVKDGKLMICEESEIARGRGDFITSDGHHSTGSLNQDKDLIAEGQGRELTFSYTCSGDTLTLSSGFLGMVKGEFRRLDPLPEVETRAAEEPELVPLP